MNQYAIFGASGCGRGVLPLARMQLESSNQDYQLVFVDDNPPSDVVNGHKVFTYSQWLAEPATNRFINIAIATSVIRERLVKQCIEDKIKFFEVRAANVVQLDDVRMGEGAILCPFVTLTSNIRIGKHFHANIYSYVEHDSIIGDYVTFAPGAKCNGNIRIEDHAYIGSGAVIKQGTSGNPLVIGRGAIVGMGAVVTKSVPPYTTVIGNPARPMIKT
jgi:sugar O-acyltransferase (sialic acid O-acetyltransferase NeuD family)